MFRYHTLNNSHANPTSSKMSIRITYYCTRNGNTMYSTTIIIPLSSLPIPIPLHQHRPRISHMRKYQLVQFRQMQNNGTGSSTQSSIKRMCLARQLNHTLNPMKRLSNYTNRVNLKLLVPDDEFWKIILHEIRNVVTANAMAVENAVNSEVVFALVGGEIMLIREIGSDLYS
jgi:hypothetical protein